MDIEKQNILQVSGLKVKFDDHTILHDISFNVIRDETLAIIGPNGAGKTVLFEALLGLIGYEGIVQWAPDVKIGYVPQKLSLGKDIPLTVLEFLQFKEKNMQKIHLVLGEVGFQTEAEHLHNDRRVLKTRIGALSGGELQRVLIAYALLGDPNVLLFDEPTAGVDIAGEETIYSLIHKLQAKVDLTIIFISHEVQVVNQYATNVLCLNREQISFGPPLKVIDKETLNKLYGGEVRLHVHKANTSLTVEHEHHEEHQHEHQSDHDHHEHND